MKLSQHISAALMEVDAAEDDEGTAVAKLVGAVYDWLDSEDVTVAIHDGPHYANPSTRQIVASLKAEAIKLPKETT